MDLFRRERRPLVEPSTGSLGSIRLSTYSFTISTGDLANRDLITLKKIAGDAKALHTSGFEPNYYLAVARSLLDRIGTPTNLDEEPLRYAMRKLKITQDDIIQTFFGGVSPTYNANRVLDEVNKVMKTLLNQKSRR